MDIALLFLRCVAFGMTSDITKAKRRSLQTAP